MEYPKYKKILFCTDFSATADRAFEYAFGIAKRDEGLLYILHVVPEYPDQEILVKFFPTDLIPSAQKNITENMKQEIQNHYVKRIEGQVKTDSVVKIGKEDQTIIQFAEEKQIDLIVMGTHGKTGIEHAILGSIAEKVIRKSPFPVFIIPLREKKVD